LREQSPLLPGYWKFRWSIVTRYSASRLHIFCHDISRTDDKMDEISNTKISKVPFLTFAPHSLPRRLDFSKSSNALLVTLFFWLVQNTKLFVVHKLQAEGNGVICLILFPEFSPKHVEPGASVAFVSLSGVIHSYE
jgi:hypothetical protein